MNKSESISALAKALVSANKKVKNPTKNATNPHFKSKYATLDSVIESYKKSYLENGISVLENPVSKDGLIGVEITLLHESGEYITHDPFMLPPGRDNAQGFGSSITYARRYALSAVMNIAADEDDDGNGASDEPKASDKTLNLVTKLLKDKADESEGKYTQEQLYALLKTRLKTNKDMENWTQSEASKAIQFLQGASA